MEPAMKTKVMGAAAAAIFGVAGLDAAFAQPAPESENGRYALSPVTDGVLRLDTRTGVASICTDKGTGWACYAMPDERAAFDEEIGRLQKDNEALKTELAQRQPTVTGKVDEPLPKTDSLKKPEPKVADGERRIEIPKIEIPLPSDRDMDRVMAFVEQAWRRLVEMANRMQKDVGGKI
jgi:hypothetical protein